MIKGLFGILVIVSVNGEYLDYENCKCRKKLVDQLVDVCTETIEEVKLPKITFAENESVNKCSSCTVYIVLMKVVFYNFYRNYYLFCLLQLVFD